MVEGVTMNGSDVRQIIAMFLGLPLEAVQPLRYGFLIKGVAADEIREKMQKKP